MSAKSVGDALLLLAGQFQSEGSVTAAVHCLEAVAQAPQALLPLTEARARRQLAALLLAHTHNVVEAKAHLEKSQLLLSQLKGHWDLKLGVTSDLGRCHKLLGNVRLQKQMYTAGLELCQSASRADASVDIPSWRVHFMLRLADSLVTAGETAAALSMIEEGLNDGLGMHQDPRMQILCYMFKLQVHLVDWSGKGPAEEDLKAIGALFGQLPGEQQQERLTMQLQLHFHVLRILLLMRLGHNSDLAEPVGGEGSGSWVPGSICAMEELLGMLGRTGGAAWEYEWTESSAVTALVSLLCARILQPTAKFKHVLAHLNKCHQIVEKELTTLQVNFSPAAEGCTRELELPHNAIWDSRLLLVLRFTALESQAHVFLTMADLPSAQHTIRAAAELISSFPMLLQQLRPSLHFLLGLYCHSTGAFGHAHSCFMASKAEALSTQWENLCSCNAALALLANGDPASASSAAGVLGDLPFKAFKVEESGDAGGEALSLQERASSLLCHGLIATRQGAPSDAKSSLSIALRIAHGQLANQQMTCQILNALAPLSMQAGDISGAEQMLASSFQISKGIRDSPALLGSVSGMSSVLTAMGDMERAAQNEEYSLRKSQELQQMAHTAQSMPNHAYLMQCARLCQQQI